jgi:membrane protease YdiL (CAAX protease family)
LTSDQSLAAPAGEVFIGPVAKRATLGLLFKSPLIFLLVSGCCLSKVLVRAGLGLPPALWIEAVLMLPALYALVREWRVQAGLTWSEIGLGPSPRAAVWLLGAVAGLLSLSAHTLISRWLPIQRAPHDFDALARASAPHWEAQLATLLMFYASVEELFFRGFFLACLRKRFGPVAAVLVSAAVFSLFHASLTNAPHHFAMGAIYGAFAIGTGSIYPLVLAHWLHNMVVVFG